MNGAQHPVARNSMSSSDFCNGMECESKESLDALRKAIRNHKEQLLCPLSVIHRGPTSKCQIIIALRTLQCSRSKALRDFNTTYVAMGSTIMIIVNTKRIEWLCNSFHSPASCKIPLLMWLGFDPAGEIDLALVLLDTLCKLD